MSCQATLPTTTKSKERLTAAQSKTLENISAACKHSVAEQIDLLKMMQKDVEAGSDTVLKASASIYQLAAISMANSSAHEQMEAFLREAGLWKTNRKVVNGLLSYILQLNRGLSSKYARVIYHAWENGIPFSEFIDFVRSEGGVEAINRKLRDIQKSKTQKSEPKDLQENLELQPNKSNTDHLLFEGRNPQTSDSGLNFEDRLADFLLTNAPRDMKSDMVTVMGQLEIGPGKSMCLNLSVFWQGHEVKSSCRRWQM